MCVICELLVVWCFQSVSLASIWEIEHPRHVTCSTICHVEPLIPIEASDVGWKHHKTSSSRMTHITMHLTVRKLSPCHICTIWPNSLWSGDFPDFIWSQVIAFYQLYGSAQNFLCSSTTKAWSCYYRGTGRTSAGPQHKSAEPAW